MTTGTRAAVAAWLALLAGASAAPLPASGAPTRGAPAPPVAAHELVSGIEARVGRDGALRLVLHDESGERVLVEARAPEAARSRGRAAAPAFTGRFREGDERGQRGFAPGADDDGDGRIDEDRADGADNDGDGRVDEDFAAISDAMAVVHQPQDGTHLEVYRWAYPHLRTTVFATWDTSPSGDGTDLSVEASGLTWHETDLTWAPPASATGARAERATLIATAVAAAGTDGARAWVGLVRLPDDAGGSRRPLRLDGSRLAVPLEGGRVALALGCAPTLLQLRFNLAQALVVHRGATGLPDGGRVPWIVPPLRQAWLSAAAPRAWCEEGSDAWRLVLGVRPGDDPLLDPSAFLLAGRPLGEPLRLRWEPAGGDQAGGWSASWKPVRPEALSFASEPEQDPFLATPALRQGRAEGRLVLEFAGLPPDVAEGGRAVLEGRFLAGRTYREEIACLAARADTTTPSPEAAVGPSRAARQESDDTSLSPDLLDNYPNPFRAHTRVRYRVPATIGEAFAGTDAAARGAADPGSPMPYRLYPPQVSLRIYSLTGQEIRTLRVGSLSPGQYETTWDGTDATGRAVASGTYFCKLQVEGWSVTKRVVYLR